MYAHDLNKKPLVVPTVKLCRGSLCMVAVVIEDDAGTKTWAYWFHKGVDNSN